MLYTIRSGCMQAQISSLGAQLMHLTGKTEYLWQGDPLAMGRFLRNLEQGRFIHIEHMEAEDIPVISSI